MTRLVCNFSVLTFCDTNKKATFCMAKVLAFYGHLKTSQLATSVNTSEAFGAPISSSFQGKRWAFSSTVSNCTRQLTPGSKPHQTDYSF
jgi:hypothetical protein